jgi:hypothetical protein
MDNNVVASPRFREIIAEIRDLGFQKGATLRRPGERGASKRRVDFNQGVDARILCKDPMYLKELATICLKPLRIAFDHLGLRKPYEQAIRYAADAGLHELSNYMLYNFRDDPADLFERMELNVKLNEELGIRIWSFPMRYQPTDLPQRSFVSDGWTRYELRSLQIILQATHGVVSGEPAFFRRAFGWNAETFRRILLMPQHFIFNRHWYDAAGGRDELFEYQGVMGRLSPSQRQELLAKLSSCDPSRFRVLRDEETDPHIKAALAFYVPISKADEREIWKKRGSKAMRQSVGDVPPPDEFVEDAGLDDDDTFVVPSRPSAIVGEMRL